MSRSKIHFSPMTLRQPAQGSAPGEVLDGEVVLSGFRSTTDVLIWVDVADALASGQKLYQAANKVWLAPGDADGTMPTTHFARAAWIGPGGAYHALWALGPGGARY